MRTRSICLSLLLLPGSAAVAQDWPQWRYDAGRGAASPHELPAELELHWSRDFGARVLAWQDPLNQDLMTFDRVLEPIVVGDKVIFNLSEREQLRALDLATGEVAWVHFTDGPARLAPAAWRDRVFVASDDGLLRCVSLDDGRLLWSRRGGPEDRRILGNGRLVNAWPARGGPVVRDDTVYFAAGIWPFMGVFLHALDAETGEQRWVNDGSSQVYGLQPHGAPSFAGVAPQGALVATEDVLLVPGGRSLPAAYDRHDGALLHFRHDTRKNEGGGSFVAANDTHYFVHVRGHTVAGYDLHRGEPAGLAIDRPVLDGEHLFAARDQRIQSTRHQTALKVPVDVDGDLIRAGSRLYAGGRGSILAVDLPDATRGFRLAWAKEVEGRVLRLVAARGRLLTVTEEGRLSCYGAGPRAEPSTQDSRPPELLGPTAEQTLTAKRILQQTGVQGGWALGYDAPIGVLDALREHGELDVVGVHHEGDVDALRRRHDRSRGPRSLSIQSGDPESFPAPPYLASLIVVDGATRARLDRGRIAALFARLRPYGGVLWIPADDAGQAPSALQQLVDSGALPGATLERVDGATLLRREGPLPGAGTWTHQYGDAANTVKSDDHRVRGPLGLLWFGGNTNEDVLPRHSHGPPEQVIGGRLIIEGDAGFSARDVYTGRVLWKREVDGLDIDGIYFDHSYDPNIPLSTTYNQKHIPGANARGTNFVATEDEVYVAVRGACLVLDAATGETLRRLALPAPEDDGAAPAWAYLAVHGELLLGGIGFASFRERAGLDARSASVDFAASRELAAFDRRSGELLWRVPARHGFLHNAIAIGGGHVYCMDALPGAVRGKIDAAPARILALERGSGRPRWTTEEDVFGTWLSYSDEHDVVLQAGSRAPDRMPGEAPRGMISYRGASGEVLWKDLDRQYIGPPILHGAHILANVNSYGTAAGMWELETGHSRGRPHVVTGEPDDWTFTRSYGCNTVVASEHLLTYRSGAAAYFDLDLHGGTWHIGGLRSGCTSNLVVADGVLNAPDYTRTCACHYQQQSSLALVPMSGLECWTVLPVDFEDCDEGARVRRLGLNFGAPGDRQHESGTPWFEWPVVGGPSPLQGIELEGELEPWRRHSSAIEGDLPWVAASGLHGVRRLVLPLLPNRRSGRPIARSGDDLEKVPGQVSDASSDLELTRESDGVQTISLRWDDVDLDPHGPMSVQFTVDEPTTEATRLSFQAVARASVPAELGEEVFELPRTQASVSWDVPGWPEVDAAGPDQRSPDLSPLLRELSEQHGWQRGQSLCLIITGEGKRVARSFDGGARQAARLHGREPTLAEIEVAPLRYTLRLVFAEPLELEVGARRFDVLVQGELVRGDLDVREATGGRLRTFVLELAEVEAGAFLELEFRPREGSRPPLLCGLELVAEGESGAR